MYVCTYVCMYVCMYGIKITLYIIFLSFYLLVLIHFYKIANGKSCRWSIFVDCGFLSIYKVIILFSLISFLHLYVYFDMCVTTFFWTYLWILILIKYQQFRCFHTWFLCHFPCYQNIYLVIPTLIQDLLYKSGSENC